MYDKIKRLLKGFDSLEVANPKLWDSLKNGINGVIIVGSTCAGKSTMVDAVREQVKCARVPKRLVTRPQRENDNLIENKFVTKDIFAQMMLSGEIGLHWTRRMELKREEKYGFEAVNPSDFSVYSGNNALYNNRASVMPRKILDDHIYIGVYAPDPVRKQRLLNRSTDLVTANAAEVEYRLKDSSEFMLPHCHILVKNYDTMQNQSAADLVKLIDHLIRQKS